MKRYLAEWVSLWRARWRFPQSRLHAGVRVDGASVLGAFTVLFDGVSVMGSRLGDHTYVQKASSVLNADVGKFCSIAGGVFIGLPRHAMEGVSSHPSFYLHNTPLVKTYSVEDHFETSRRTTVGHDVWIGQNALIMGGLTVGHGAVIGAGAVVTVDVPAYAVVGGVPARILKHRFPPDVVQGLLRSLWWDRPEAWREENHRLFRDPEAFLDALGKEDRP